MGIHAIVEAHTQKQGSRTFDHHYHHNACHNFYVNKLMLGVDFTLVVVKF